MQNFFRTLTGMAAALGLAAVLLLDFITEELGPEFYNLGVMDSYRCMQDMAEDLLAIRK